MIVHHIALTFTCELPTLERMDRASKAALALLLAVTIVACSTAPPATPRFDFSTGNPFYDAALAIASADSVGTVAGTAEAVYAALNPDFDAPPNTALSLPVLRYVRVSDPRVASPLAWATAIDVAFRELSENPDVLPEVWAATMTLADALAAESADSETADALVVLFAGLLTAPEDESEVLMQVLDTILVIESPELRADTLMRVLEVYTQRRDVGTLNSLVQHLLASIPLIESPVGRLAVLTRLVPLARRLGVGTDLREPLVQTTQLVAGLPRVLLLHEERVLAAAIGRMAEQDLTVEAIRIIEPQRAESARARAFAQLARTAYLRNRRASAHAYLTTAWLHGQAVRDILERSTVLAELAALGSTFEPQYSVVSAVRTEAAQYTAPVLAALDNRAAVAAGFAAALYMGGFPSEAVTVINRLTRFDATAAYVTVSRAALDARLPTPAREAARRADQLLGLLLPSAGAEDQEERLQIAAREVAGALIEVGEVSAGLRYLSVITDPAAAAALLVAVPPSYQAAPAEMELVQATRAAFGR